MVMKILGYNEGNINFDKGSDSFSAPSHVKEFPSLRGQLHIVRGPLSRLTAIVREYLSPYSWYPVYIFEGQNSGEIRKGNTLKRALLYIPNQEGSALLDRLKGESPFWAERIGDGSLQEFRGREFLVEKDKYWSTRPVGTYSSTHQMIQQTRNGYIPIYRGKTLIEKIKLIFMKLIGISKLMEVRVPSTKEKFWIKPIDYNSACQILGVKLEYDQKYQNVVERKYPVGCSADVYWLST